MALLEADLTARNINGGKIINPETGLSIPEYDIRNLDHQEIIARSLASGGQVGMFAGIWGGFKGVIRNTENERFFHDIKVDRPREAKIAMLVSPADYLKLIDWSKVHPDFRNLSTYENYKKLWSTHGSYLHVIAPIRESLNSMPDVFVTTPDDYAKRYPNEDPMPYETICGFWRDEPYIKHLDSLVKRFSHTDIKVGATSLNRHKEQPASSYKEFVEQSKDGRVDATKFNMIIRDSTNEKSEALGSHTQVRLPFPGEYPTIKVLRIGVLSPEKFSESTGLPIEIRPDAKDVKIKPGFNVDDYIELNRQEIAEQWRKEKPRVFFRD